MIVFPLSPFFRKRFVFKRNKIVYHTIDTFILGTELIKFKSIENLAKALHLHSLDRKVLITLQGIFRISLL